MSEPTDGEAAGPSTVYGAVPFDADQIAAALPVGETIPRVVKPVWSFTNFITDLSPVNLVPMSPESVAAMFRDPYYRYPYSPWLRCDRNPFPKFVPFPLVAKLEALGARIKAAVVEARWRVNTAVDVLLHGDTGDW